MNLPCHGEQSGPTIDSRGESGHWRSTGVSVQKRSSDNPFACCAGPVASL